jgi:hypothetical protein
MKHLLLSALTCGAVVGFAGATQAGALLEHASHSNAVNHCQAFTPGPSNTIRNRVIGVENIGAAPVAVACAFHSLESLLYTRPREVTIYTSNTGASPVTVNCTMLVGHFGEAGAYAVNRTVDVPANAQRGPHVRFSAADNPAPLSPTLGDHLVGVNCTLPFGGGLNETELVWDEIL